MELVVDSWTGRFHKPLREQPSRCGSRSRPVASVSGGLPSEDAPNFGEVDVEQLGHAGRRTGQTLCRLHQASVDVHEEEGHLLLHFRQRKLGGF